VRDEMHGCLLTLTTLPTLANPPGDYILKFCLNLLPYERNLHEILQ
jgi:hypothetical protein